MSTGNVRKTIKQRHLLKKGGNTESKRYRALIVTAVSHIPGADATPPLCRAHRFILRTIFCFPTKNVCRTRSGTAAYALSMLF